MNGLVRKGEGYRFLPVSPGLRYLTTSGAELDRGSRVDSIAAVYRKESYRTPAGGARGPRALSKLSDAA